MIVPELINAENQLIEAREEMKAQFKAEGFKIDPFTEEFGPLHGPKTVPFDEVEKQVSFLLSPRVL